MKKLSIIIPVFNEAKTVDLILSKIENVILLHNLVKEIIIVDDYSTDNTLEIIKNYIATHSDIAIKLLQHQKNKGKGASLQTGIKNATGNYIVIQDADLEYDPNEYNILLQPIISGHADVVYGSRFMGGNPHRVLFFWHTIGNRFLTFLSNMCTNLNLTDMETCYKMFDAKILQSIALKENRFGFESEVTAKVSRIKKIRIYEVGISYYGRTYEEGKKINWKDGIHAIYCIVKYGFFRL